MKTRINRILSKQCVDCLNSVVPKVLLLIMLHGQSYAQWQRTNLPDSVQVDALKIGDSFIVAGTNGDGIFVSTDDGENWTRSNKGLQDKMIHTVLILGNTMFAGTATGVSVSTDNGENWRSINAGLSGSGVWSLEVSAGTAGDTTIFAGSWGGVYSSTDRGEHWKVTGLSSTRVPVHSIIVFRDRIFAATFSEGIFISQDNGLTWKNIIIPSQDTTVRYEQSVPICSLAKLVGTFFNYIVAGSSFGDFYYMDYRGSDFLDAYTLGKQAAGLLCFASRNDTLFAANSFGYFFETHYSKGRLVCNPSIIPYLWNLAIYSLAMDNTYIFAGTEDGIWRLKYPGATTGVESSQDVPAGFVLEQNYPNPFNSSTILQYTLPTRSHVRILVYNILGQIVVDLLNEEQADGRNQVVWNANVVSGLYFCRLEAISVSNPSKRFVDAKKMILLK